MSLVVSFSALDLHLAARLGAICVFTQMAIAAVCVLLARVCTNDAQTSTSDLDHHLLLSLARDHSFPHRSIHRSHSPLLITFHGLLVGRATHVHYPLSITQATHPSSCRSHPLLSTLPPTPELLFILRILRIISIPHPWLATVNSFARTPLLRRST